MDKTSAKRITGAGAQQSVPTRHSQGESQAQRESHKQGGQFEDLKADLSALNDIKARKQKNGTLRRLHDDLIKSNLLKVSENPKRKGAKRDRFIVDFTQEAWMEREREMDLAALAANTSSQYTM